MEKISSKNLCNISLRYLVIARTHYRLRSARGPSVTPYNIKKSWRRQAWGISSIILLFGKDECINRKWEKMYKVPEKESKTSRKINNKRLQKKKEEKINTNGSTPQIAIAVNKRRDGESRKGPGSWQLDISLEIWKHGDMEI